MKSEGCVVELRPLQTLDIIMLVLHAKGTVPSRYQRSQLSTKHLGWSSYTLIKIFCEMASFFEPSHEAKGSQNCFFAVIQGHRMS